MVATGPRDWDALLLVSVRDPKVRGRYFHLAKSFSRLSGTHTTLFHEMEERRDQILIKVKVIVIHPSGHKQTTRPTTIVMQVFGMLTVYQGILHSMHQKSGAFDILNFVDVLESILDQVL